MALLPQNQRDQLLMLGIVAALGLVYVYHTYVYTPKAEELATVSEHVDALTRVNDAAKRALAQGSVSQLQADAERYRRDLQAMRQLVPTANEVPVLLDQISTAARRVGLELSDVNPEPVINGDFFDVYRYRISITGDYHTVAEFLTNVGSLTRVVAPINVQLAPTTKVRRVARANQALIDANLQLQTYVAHGRGGAGAR
jgi:type IV pilus assembly protein PilO